MANKMLEMDLSPEDEKLLRESLESWKESVYSNLLEEVEVLKEKTIQELEEANQEYLSEIKKEYTAKMVKALNEMREDIRSEVFTEMVTSNPELQILEKIKSLVAPTLNEEFNGNVYSEQINNLVEENSSLKREMELNEGARTLAGLIKDFDRKTQKLILSVIKEGNADEITEQFYQIAESLELFEEKGEDGEEMPEEDEEVDGEKETSDAKYHSLTDWKEDGKPEPKKGDFEDDADYKKAKAQWTTDDEDKEEKVEEAYNEWIASEPSRKDFELKEDYEYAHSLWEEDEPKEDEEDEEESDDEEDEEPKSKKKAKEDDEEESDEEEDEDDGEEKDEEKPKSKKVVKPAAVEESVKIGRKGLKSYINEGTVGRQSSAKKEGTNKDAILKLI